MSNPATKSVKGLGRSLTLLAEGQRAVAHMLVAISQQGLGPDGNAMFSRARQRFEMVETSMINEGLLSPRIIQK